MKKSMKLMIFCAICGIFGCFKVGAMEKDLKKYEARHFNLRPLCEIKDEKTGETYTKDMFIDFDYFEYSVVANKVLECLKSCFFPNSLESRFKDLKVCENEADYLAEVFSIYVEKVVLKDLKKMLDGYGYEGKQAYCCVKEFAQEMKNNLKLVSKKFKDRLGNVFYKKELKVLKNDVVEKYLHQYVTSLDPGFPSLELSQHEEMNYIINCFICALGNVIQFVGEYNRNYGEFLKYYEKDRSAYMDLKQKIE